LRSALKRGPSGSRNSEAYSKAGPPDCVHGWAGCWMGGARSRCRSSGRGSLLARICHGVVAPTLERLADNELARPSTCSGTKLQRPDLALIKKTLIDTRGNVTAAARSLHVPKSGSRGDFFGHPVPPPPGSVWGAPR